MIVLPLNRDPSIPFKVWNLDKATLKMWYRSWIPVESLTKRHQNKLIIAHLNINLLRNKFEFRTEQIKGIIYILMESETKLDNSLTTGQFLIEGSSYSFRLDSNKYGGVIRLYVWQTVPLPSWHILKNYFKKVFCWNKFDKTKLVNKLPLKPM